MSLHSAVDNLARMVALSPTFQEEVSKYSAGGADTRIHRIVVKEPESLPRPFALIEIGDFNKTRIAGGARNVYDSEGFLILQLAADFHRDNEEAALLDFAAWTYQVINEVSELGGFDDYLNATSFEQEQKPVFSGELGGAVVPWCWASWRIPWEMF